jgi:flagellar motor switch protein FliN/FliY
MSDSLTIQHLADVLVAELCSAMHGAVGGAVVVPSSAPALGPGWRLHAKLTGNMRGGLIAWIDVSGAEMLAERVRNLSAPVAPDVITGVLRDLFADAARATSLKDQFGGVTLTPGSIERGEAEADATVYELRAGEAVVWMAIGGQAASAAAEPTIPTAVSAASAAKLDVVLDIELPLIVRFGRTQMTLRALSQVGPGSIIDMERSPDEPVQMLVGEQVIARGEVVVVGGHYGVRVLDLVSAADRVRVLEA